MKLDYKIIDKDHYDTDAYSVFIDVTNKEQPGTAAYVELRYAVELDDFKVDISGGDATYVDYGSTSVAYDDGFSLEGIDASEAVSLYDYFICDEDLEPFHFDETDRDGYMNETAKLLNCTVEELESAIMAANKEVIKVVISNLEKYYREHDYELPDHLFKAEEPDVDWSDLDWD